ncbi:Peptidoglycan-binding (PGRP) domain of peptidoglycan hydrolases-containing protein [Butyrivibrio hungatei DSM 14810]|uniref:Peptidoglycan-binding (PGRP) domain of peptidoglycan hydrolases-containing protein n=1 Tax=Butyrivibrio hungatei DSM 14810 TaxID=1121132 RepID=A0A1M7SU47_9FIRM|nr:glycoside hydrolase domain-containing protein [Butyrivibrio hungatei]SHN62009.1 Peptidoglycan-binding (PGRP) domain of peptidoglycan hydrolases-containing protein [Butyrivibrio hungatei DSM 14810]
MDEMVKQTQEWLNKTYKSKKGFTKFNDNEIDGITGQGTFKRLVQALQIELNENFGSKLTVDGDFGKSTLNALPLYIEKGFPYKNIVKIIQGSFWCKGYSAGPLDGIFGKSVDSAVKKFERDAGIPETGSITGIKLQGIMNTDAYFFQGEEGTLAYHQHRVQKAMNRKYCTDFGLIAPNGLWERKSHKMLIKCCQKVWGITNIDGAWGNDCKKAAPTLTNGTTNSENVLLLSWALTINGFYTGEFTSTLSNDLLESIRNFQDFMCIKRENVVEKGSWASLLSSKGDTGRDVKAFDTATRLTEAQANFFKSNGYTDVGRYLTNTVNGTLDKKMTLEELKAISNAGLKVFPIYQTRGNNVGYFTNSSQGHSDAKEALKAAHDLFFPYGTTIYFAVDYDVKTADIEKYIVPYFRNIKAVLDGTYKIGVYGPRAVCNILASHGLTSSSFVADMSSGFTCNIGQPMPKNWAYEQVVEVTQGGIGIDRCNISPASTGVLINFPSSETEDEKRKEKLIIYTANTIRENEGNYDGIDENGILSIGLLQWRASRAYTLLSRIRDKDKSFFDATFSNVPSSMIITGLDSGDINSFNNLYASDLSSEEISSLKRILVSDISKETQDVLIIEDVTKYINLGTDKKIRSNKVLIYFADCYNQSPKAISRFEDQGINWESVTLDELHNLALADKALGKYISRRNSVYEKANAYNE